MARALDWCEEDTLASAAMGLGAIYLPETKGLSVDQEFKKRFPASFAKSIPAVVASDAHSTRMLVTGEPFATGPLDEIEMALGLLPLCVTTPANVFALISRGYPEEAMRAAHGLASEGEAVNDLVKTVVSSTDLLDFSDSAPAAKLVSELLFRASRLRASDLHIQPGEDRLSVRFRVDGVLHEALSLPKEVHRPLLTRLKIMSGMDIAESRIPQDGRASVRSGSARYDLRLATVPTVWGERLVVRVLDKDRDLIDLYGLGIAADEAGLLLDLAERTSGMLLVAGPTGSGKTTTLYALISRIDVAQRNVLTIEDPVEYRIGGVSQIQINPRAGVTFSDALRGILRQDPDVIYVGEIRDADTATTAMRAALTGHMVFSTIHTRDASTAVTRLVDIGTDPYLVSAGVSATVAQRLVRTICPSCVRRRAPDEAERSVFKAAGLSVPEQVSYGEGCSECLGTGFLGRKGVFEVLEVDAQVRAMILENTAATEIAAYSRSRGRRSLRQAGIELAARGVTTLEEVIGMTEKEA